MLGLQRHVLQGGRKIVMLGKLGAVWLGKQRSVALGKQRNILVGMQKNVVLGEQRGVLLGEQISFCSSTWSLSTLPAPLIPRSPLLLLGSLAPPCSIMNYYDYSHYRISALSFSLVVGFGCWWILVAGGFWLLVGFGGWWVLTAGRFWLLVFWLCAPFKLKCMLTYMNHCI